MFNSSNSGFDEENLVRAGSQVVKGHFTGQKRFYWNADKTGLFPEGHLEAKFLEYGQNKYIPEDIYVKYDLAQYFDKPEEPKTPRLIPEDTEGETVLETKLDVKPSKEKKKEAGKTESTSETKS